jgi:uncharacterized protein YbcV (DUF1398 family)
MNTDTIAECMKLSFASTPFPQVVQRLASAGVRSYDADLVKLRKTYYDAGNDTAEERMPLTSSPAIPAGFDKAGVAATVRDIQQGRIGYPEFLRRIMSAGCSRYSVYIGGRKAIYFGRDGDFHIEDFPSGK